MSNSISQNMLSVYITSLIPAALTYIFWLVAANNTSAEVIGIVITLASFSSLLVAISGLDIGIGMKRFLGKAQAENDWVKFKQIVSASTLITIITTIVILLIALNPIFNLLSYFSIEEKYIPIIVVIVISNALLSVTSNSIISALKSKLLIIPYLVGSVGRFPILFSLFYFLDVSELNVAWAYSSHLIILSAVLLGLNVYVLRKSSGHFFTNFFSNSKLVIQASVAKWLPQLIGVIETQFSILALFALKGGLETGLYYISYAIFGVISMIGSAINMVSHPVLSGMELQTQREFLLKTLKFGFILTMPFGVIAYFYSEPILSVFGNEFSVSTEIISILLIALPVAIIMDGCYYLLYARGDYKGILYLGFGVNIVRIICYIILVPSYGGIGAATAYVIGSIVQLIFTIILIQKISLKLEYKMYFLIGIIPVTIGYLLEVANVGILGFLVVLIGSFIIYSKIKLVKEDDIETLLGTFMKKEKSRETSQKIVSKLKKFHLM